MIDNVSLRIAYSFLPDFQNEWHYLAEWNVHRRNSEVNIVYAGLRRHKVYFINSIGDRLRHIAFLPDSRREKNQARRDHSNLLSLRRPSHRLF